MVNNMHCSLKFNLYTKPNKFWHPLWISSLKVRILWVEIMYIKRAATLHTKQEVIGPWFGFSTISTEIFTYILLLNRTTKQQKVKFWDLQLRSPTFLQLLKPKGCIVFHLKVFISEPLILLCISKEPSSTFKIYYVGSKFPNICSIYVVV